MRELTARPDPLAGFQSRERAGKGQGGGRERAGKDFKKMEGENERDREDREREGVRPSKSTLDQPCIAVKTYTNLRRRDVQFASHHVRKVCNVTNIQSHSHTVITQHVTVVKSERRG